MTFKPGSYRSKYYDQYESESSPFASSFMDGDNFLDTARGYHAAGQSGVSPVPVGEGVFDTGGTSALVGGALGEQSAQNQMAMGALNSWADMKSAVMQAEAQKAAASKQASASKTGSIIGGVASVGGAIAGALI